jgi:2-hydroxychromene-2-carboxylate isomerase
VSARAFASQLITSRRIRAAVRGWHGTKRILTGKPRTLLVFLEPGEPYSELLADVVPGFAAHYGLEWTALAVSAPEKSAAPEPDMLAAYAKRDAAGLRAAYGIPAADTRLTPEGDPAANARWRKKHGHYGSGMIWFEGEWYWGIDRLHHLERRLGANEDALLFPPRAEPTHATGGSFDMYFSLRSPYSYLAMMRAPDLARLWKADLVLKPILPMVMRSLPVPSEKRLYIVRDCKREAERLGIPFGKIEDPVGAGVERGLAILHRAIPDGKGVDFAQSFYRGVWAEGLNAATDKGLRTMVERAGLDWAHAQNAIADESWRDAVEANRQEMFGLGLWGVPSFRVGDHSTFGQDRLWQVGRWLEES